MVMRGSMKRMILCLGCSTALSVTRQVDGRLTADCPFCHLHHEVLR